MENPPQGWHDIGAMADKIYSTIEEEIATLKKGRDAVILAHNYQTVDVQKVADEVGDSLYLARVASRLKAKVVVFAGVHFMAESVKILSPEKLVLMPDLDAGCSLANTIKAADVRAWRAKFPEGMVVTYVNSTAEVKAESDICCTSANAVSVVKTLPEHKPVLFVPDFFLGLFVQRKLDRPLHLWRGFCHVHERITSAGVEAAKKEHPGARLLMHPECGCLTKSMPLADEILSTSGMVEFVAKSSDKDFLIATEIGLVEQLKDRFPEKRFTPVGDNAVCEYMKLNTLEKIVISLEKLQYPVEVDPEVAAKARRAIERMVAIS